MAVVPVQLAVGGAQQTVEVRSDATLVQTTNDLGETIGQQDILDLPLNGRNFSQLGLLLPGAAPLTQGLQVAGGSLRGGQSYAVNGQRPESNQFLIDGAENYNSVNGGFVLKPPPDAIAEFRILTNTASAEFTAHNSGSNTSIVTSVRDRDRFHGDVYEFLRNDALDARNFFSQNTEPLKQNQFGGTLGGPIRRDKTFFFGYYEGFRNRQGETLLTTVPTAAERQGDFSALCSSYSPQGFCTNPSGTQLVNVFAPTPQPIPFNTLPGALISPVSQNLLALYPLPNTPNYGPNAYGTTQELQNTSDQFGLRIDHYLSTRDTFSFHYLFNNGSQVDPLPISGSKRARIPGGRGLPGPERRSGRDPHFFAKRGECGSLLLPAKQISFWPGGESHRACFTGIPVFAHAAGSGRAALHRGGRLQLRWVIPITGPAGQLSEFFLIRRLRRLGARQARLEIRRPGRARSGEQSDGHCLERFFCVCPCSDHWKRVR